jgi:hypothetical protein
MPRCKTNRSQTGSYACPRGCAVSFPTGRGLGAHARRVHRCTTAQLLNDEYHRRPVEWSDDDDDPIRPPTAAGAGVRASAGSQPPPAGKMYVSSVYYRLLSLIIDYNRGQILDGRTYSDSLLAAFAMASDASKWDIKMLLRLITDARFDPREVTFPNADALLAEITAAVKTVYINSYTIIIDDNRL